MLALVELLARAWIGAWATSQGHSLSQQLLNVNSPSELGGGSGILVFTFYRAVLLNWYILPIRTRGLEHILLGSCVVCLSVTDTI